jgi:hypothetical protein
VRVSVTQVCLAPSASSIACERTRASPSAGLSSSASRRCRPVKAPRELRGERCDGEFFHDPLTP